VFCEACWQRAGLKSQDRIRNEINRKKSFTAWLFNGAVFKLKLVLFRCFTVTVNHYLHCKPACPSCFSLHVRLAADEADWVCFKCYERFNFLPKLQ